MVWLDVLVDRWVALGLRSSSDVSLAPTKTWHDLSRPTVICFDRMMMAVPWLCCCLGSCTDLKTCLLYTSDPADELTRVYVSGGGLPEFEGPDVFVEGRLGPGVHS